MTKTKTITDIDYPRDPDWQIVGVFPPQDYVDEHGLEAALGDWVAFCYTASGRDYELWCPTASIEGRYAGPHLIGSVLNLLRVGIDDGTFNPGDDVLVPLGVEIDGEVVDQDAVFWLGDPVDDGAENRYQCNVGPSSDIVMPIRWSSPLGWDDE
jgi:hypothetical protein